MINYYGQNKMIAYMKNFYEDYKKDLWKEMQLYPMKETQDLYKSFLKR